MTPAARLQAAAGVLDQILGGQAPEPALLEWARKSRFAGSKDRAAVRDHVFDALRQRRSLAVLGGSATGRGLVLGLLRAAGGDYGLLGADRYAAAALSPAERAYLEAPVAMSELQALDCPDWLAPELRRALGADFALVMAALRERAPVFLRVNLARGDVTQALAALRAEGIDAHPHPLADTALEVTANARRLRNSAPYQRGLVELQDAASQAVVAALEPLQGQNVLDYCAGGGGKALAMAALGARVHAHDIDPGRMRDLPARAERAGVTIAQGNPAGGCFDLVLADAPCSGSGSWRRDPAGKWALTPDRLAALQQQQADVLDAALAYLRPGGRLAYATCSLLQAENEDVIAALQRRTPGLRMGTQHRFTPLQGGDGFYLAVLERR